MERRNINGEKVKKEEKMKERKILLERKSPRLCKKQRNKQPKVRRKK